MAARKAMTILNTVNTGDEYLEMLKTLCSDSKDPCISRALRYIKEDYAYGSIHIDDAATLKN